MTKIRNTALVLSIIILVSIIFPLNIFADSNGKNQRTVYLHAQGTNPETTNLSTVYMGETAEIYFAVDNPNKGEVENNIHKEPQYDMNGYTLRICFEPEFFDFAGADNSAPIDYSVPDGNFGDSGFVDEETGDGSDVEVPESVGYYIYKHGSGIYEFAGKIYKTAYITVFFSGGFLPAKDEGALWYNLAKLSLTPKKDGYTEVFVDLESDEEGYELELFAKNQSDNLNDQTFAFDAVNGGHHSIIIKDKSKPAPPVATPSSGSFTEKVTVELTHTDGLPIYYTVDGSEPAGSSSRILYTGPIEIDVNTKIRACAYREFDNKYSASVTYEYEILPERPYLFNTSRELMQDIYNSSSEFDVYVSDKQIFGDIADENEVYYTFSNENIANKGDNPENSWVKVSKQHPVIHIDQKRTVRLITDRMGRLSNTAVYYFSIKPAAPVASEESGEYNEKLDVTLSCETQGATIYYTLDGSDPITSLNRVEYAGIPITLSRDTILRTVSFVNGSWSEKNSYYYLIKLLNNDDIIEAFYPSGVYEGNVSVTLIPNNPEAKVLYRENNGAWKEYKTTLVLDRDTEIVAKMVEYNADGTIKKEGTEHKFTYIIKPLPPVFAPESTQFTSAENITVYTPESTAENTGRYELYYTLDGTDPTTSNTRIKAEAASDTAEININKYTVVNAVVLKDGTTYSDVVRNSYDIVTVKPVSPLVTLLPGDYAKEIGGEHHYTQFMPVSKGTTIYYTISYGGAVCPDPVPGAEGTLVYDGESMIDVAGNTIIKAVAVNSFGERSDIGIFSYVVTPETPIAAPSTTINGTEFPVVPVYAVKGSTVKYKVGEFENQFVNSDDELFYIDTHTGNAYRDKECTIPLGSVTNDENEGGIVHLEILSNYAGVDSDVGRYTYVLTTDDVLSPPYADEKTGVYEEIRIDNDNNFLKVNLFSLNSGGIIQYRKENSGEWQDYDENKGVLINSDTILQLRYKKGEKYSLITSYVYTFIPIPPIIELQPGTYLKDDNKMTTISYHPLAPTDKIDDGTYSIWYRRNGDAIDFRYGGQELAILKTMSFRAFVFNSETQRASKNTIHYYIIENEKVVDGDIMIAYPYDKQRISAHLIGLGEYAEGIKLTTQNRTADIHYYYSYKKTGTDQTFTTNTAVYNVTRPIIPTEFMDDITIVAWLQDEDGRIAGSENTFKIDFVHLGIPETSLESSDRVEFPRGTKYTLINEHAGDENVVLYYTLDGSDPTINGIEYQGEELTIDKNTTVKAVYYSACGKCVECRVPNKKGCWDGVYGAVGTYKYSIPTTIVHGAGGGVGGAMIDNSRKYTKDIFGMEHPTHIGYINGYPDGSVKPDGFITREEIAAILYRITNHEYEKPFAASGNVFPDVEVNRWSAHDIEYMTDKNIFFGYPDGEFKPARNLSRAEFAALIFRFAKMKEKKIKNPFYDLDESHWAYKEILTLVENGLVEGYEDKSFRAEQSITRAEVMTVINKLLGRKPVENYVKSLKFNPYNDLDSDKWYYVTVLEATITHSYMLDKLDYEYEWESWK